MAEVYNWATKFKTRHDKLARRKLFWAKHTRNVVHWWLRSPNKGLFFLLEFRRWFKSDTHVQCKARGLCWKNASVVSYSFCDKSKFCAIGIF